MDSRLVPWKFATGIALIAFGMSLVAGRSTAAVVGYTIAVFGLFYAAGLVLAAYLDAGNYAKGQTTERPPEQPQLPGTSEPEATVDDITRFEAQHLLPNNRMRIGNQVIDIPNYIDTEHLVMVAEERERGRMPNVSANSLHDIGISRHGGDSAPGKLLVYFLEKIGAVEDMGERRPYEWTERGERVFPSPPPQNGTNGYSSQVARVRATARPRPRLHDSSSDWQ